MKINGEFRRYKKDKDIKIRSYKYLIYKAKVDKLLSQQERGINL